MYKKEFQEDLTKEFAELAQSTEVRQFINAVRVSCLMKKQAKRDYIANSVPYGYADHLRCRICAKHVEPSQLLHCKQCDDKLICIWCARDGPKL